MNSLSYYAQVVIENELWVSNIRFNGLFRIEMESGKAVFVGRFPRHDRENEELHLFAKKYWDKIYFFPKKSRGIDIYDLKKGTFSYVECETDSVNGYATAVDAFCMDGDSVVILPCYAGTPLQVFSLKKENIIQKVELKRANQYVNNETNTRALYACKVQDEIFYPIFGTNKVGSYVYKEKKEKIYSIEGLKRIRGDMVSDGKNLWINADQGIYQWNPYEGNLKFVCDCSSEKEGWIEKFILYNQMLICIPRWLNHIKFIDRKNFSLREIHIDRSILSKNIDMSWRDVRESVIWRDTLIIFPIKYKETICVGLVNDKVLYPQWGILETLPIKKDFFIHEETEEDLRNYISMIDEKKIFLCEKNNRIGHYIMQTVKIGEG